METTNDVISKIKSAIGKKVSFKYPGNEGNKHGILKDRSVIVSMNEIGTVPYWDVVDLIEFKGEKEPDWIRIGYYRKPNNKLNWGRVLLVNAIRLIINSNFLQRIQQVS